MDDMGVTEPTDTQENSRPAKKKQTSIADDFENYEYYDEDYSLENNLEQPTKKQKTKSSRNSKQTTTVKIDFEKIKRENLQMDKTSTPLKELQVVKPVPKKPARQKPPTKFITDAVECQINTDSDEEAIAGEAMPKCTASVGDGMVNGFTQINKMLMVQSRQIQKINQKIDNIANRFSAMEQNICALSVQRHAVHRILWPIPSKEKLDELENLVRTDDSMKAALRAKFEHGDKTSLHTFMKGNIVKLLGNAGRFTWTGSLSNSALHFSAPPRSAAASSLATIKLLQGKQ